MTPDTFVFPSATTESKVEEWFLKNYKHIGFDEVLPCDGIGDFQVKRNGQIYHVELEGTTSGFFLHKKEMRDAIDIIICYKKNYINLHTIEDLGKLLELYNHEIIELRTFVDWDGSKTYVR